MKGLKTGIYLTVAGLATLWLIKGVFRVFTTAELIGIVVLLSMAAGMAIHYRSYIETRVLSEAERSKAEYKSAIDELKLRAEQAEYDDQRRFAKIVKTMDRFHEEFRKEASVWKE